MNLKTLQIFFTDNIKILYKFIDNNRNMVFCAVLFIVVILYSTLQPSFNKLITEEFAGEFDPDYEEDLNTDVDESLLNEYEEDSDTGDIDSDEPFVNGTLISDEYDDEYSTPIYPESETMV